MDSLTRSLGRGCTRRRRLRRQSEKRRYSENPSEAVALDNKKCLFTAGLRTWWNVARSLKANDYARDRCVELESPRARTGHFYFAAISRFAPVALLRWHLFHALNYLVVRSRSRWRTKCWTSRETRRCIITSAISSVNILCHTRKKWEKLKCTLFFSSSW